jgi:hypothetical protein
MKREICSLVREIYQAMDKKRLQGECERSSIIINPKLQNSAIG